MNDKNLKLRGTMTIILSLIVVTQSYSQVTELVAPMATQRIS